MSLSDPSSLLEQLCPPLNTVLAEQLINEFISLERRYVLRDWEPAELDGGQFAEILARVLYHIDSGTLNVSKPFDECLRFVEDSKNANIQKITPHNSALHLARVLRTVYKFRSQRGAVHISSTYSANHMDARLIAECVRWLMMEAIRLFLQCSQESAVKLIRELLEFDVPCVGKFDDVLLVQRTDLSSEEEILILLHYSGQSGLSRRDIGIHCLCAASAISKSISKLASPNYRQVIKLPSGNFRLSDLGEKRIREKMADKLLVQK